MAEDEYDRRQKMTPMEKYRESGTKMLKGLFGGGLGGIFKNIFNWKNRSG